MADAKRLALTHMVEALVPKMRRGGDVHVCGKWVAPGLRACVIARWTGRPMTMTHEQSVSVGPHYVEIGYQPLC